MDFSDSGFRSQVTTKTLLNGAHYNKRRAACFGALAITI